MDVVVSSKTIFLKNLTAAANNSAKESEIEAMSSSQSQIYYSDKYEDDEYEYR